MLPITTSEIEQIKKLREKTLDILYTDEFYSDAYLVRWLRARDHNLDKAELMLRKSLKWRLDNKIDFIINETFPPELYTKLPFTIGNQWDREGRPVITCHYGSWDVRSLCDTGQKELVIKWADLILETMSREIQNTSRNSKGERISQFIGIYNMEGYSYWGQLSLKTMQSYIEMSSHLESHFPEMLKTAYFIHAPSMWKVLYNLVKPVMSSKTLEKFIVFQSSDNWREKIAKVIDPDQIGKEFGGNRNS